MKCALCGAEWKTEGELGGQRHAERRCPLNGIAIYRPQVEAINAAIKQARGNTQKPDGCLWTYTRDNRQGSGNTPMEAFEQWREMIKPKKPHPLAESRKGNF